MYHLNAKMNLIILTSSELTIRSSRITIRLSKEVRRASINWVRLKEAPDRRRVDIWFTICQWSEMYGWSAVISDTTASSTRSLRSVVLRKIALKATHSLGEKQESDLLSYDAYRFVANHQYPTSLSASKCLNMIKANVLRSNMATRPERHGKCPQATVDIK